ncbi:hypothetical protein Y032_0011g1540 [Ancylostoma ceylanicum]|uniref:Reverse transcriptase domain-containing protein n=1 Tax=Ancylostoma ceylanicum TaxID=53326 RepID=A0A016VFA1_9BILA|nr:hypothetical protein Y032_0011g1540 [Ancylostoma ceylanicum]
MLASDDKQELERQKQAWSYRLARFDLRLNVRKREYLTTSVDEHDTISVNGVDLPSTEVFEYLESAMSSDGNLCQGSAVEVKMLHWMAGATRFDRVCSQDVRKRFGVAAITDKFRESRFRWYGHVLRADKDTVGEICLDLVLSTKRLKGRPKQRWLNTLTAELKSLYASKYILIYTQVLFESTKYNIYRSILEITAMLPKYNTKT